MVVANQTKLYILLPMTVITTVCFVAATVGKAWTTFRDDTLNINVSYGLWESCTIHRSVFACYDTQDLLSFTSHNNACRILSVIACTLSFGAILFTILITLTDKISGYTVGVEAIIATIFMTYCLALYSARHKAIDPNSHVLSNITFGWSYMLAWCGVISCISTAVVAFFL